MRTNLNLGAVRPLWLALGCAIVFLASTVCLAIPSGTWSGNIDHDMPDRSKVCAEWEAIGVENDFCSIAPRYLGTSNFSACQEAFRHSH